jgi:hypothetical protein
MLTDQLKVTQLLGCSVYLDIEDFFLSMMSANLALSNPIFLPTAYSHSLILFGRERGWLITCNYPTVLKEKNMENQKE